MSKGSWKEVAPLLESVKKDDIYMLKILVGSYLKTVLIRNGSLKLAQGMKLITECHDNVGSFVANVRIACDIIKPEIMTESTEVPKIKKTKKAESNPKIEP